MTDVATLDPTAWPSDEVEAYLEASVELRDLHSRSGIGSTAMIIGSTGPFAQLAGRKVLEAGGSSVDAAVATALTQIALAGGAWVSYAGIASFVHHDAASGETLSLSGGYKSFAGETDPMTIPRGEPSGRSAFVPGFFAGLQTAHDRFGRLPWSALFAPAIFVAERGFRLGATRAVHFKMREDVLLRTPEAREAFDLNGSVPVAGDVVRQLRLADTLRMVATHGADYIYRGDWARRFVDVVNREGGKASLDDLANYHIEWTDPLWSTFNGFDIAALGFPDYGGAALLEGLNLVELAGIGDPRSDPELLFWMIQIARQSHVFGAMGNFVGEPAPATRATKEHADRVWAAMQEAGGFVGRRAFIGGTHSDFVAATDADGNVTSVCHTINTNMWGSTGLFVDGISIPDSASIQPELIAAYPPSSPMPNPTNPAIVLRNGKPVLASSAIGNGLPETTVQCLLAVLGRGEAVSEVVRGPFYHGPSFIVGDSINSEVKVRDATPDDVTSRESQRVDPVAAQKRLQERIEKLRSSGVADSEVFGELLRSMPHGIEDRWDPKVLEAVRAKGLALSAIGRDDPNLPRGYWVGISIDRQNGRIEGGRTSFCNGSVEGL